MALTDELGGLIASTDGSFGNVASFGSTFLVFFFVMIIFGLLLVVAIATGKNARYNTVLNVFIPFRDGFRMKKLRAGLLPNKKTGKLEFIIKKPRLVINNYNPEWTIPTSLKGFKGAMAKDTAFAVLTSNNKYEMLNPQLVREDGSYIAFVAKNIGKDRLSELMDSQTEELFDTNDFMAKYGAQIFMGSVMFIQILMVILLIQYGNKIL